MKLTIPTIGVLATVIVLASVGGIYAISFNSDFAKNNNPLGAAMMLGNVKVTHFDEDGDVIGYRHGSNHITATGMQVIMGQLFAGKNATFGDPGNVTGRVKYMQIGYGGAPVTYTNQLRWNNTDIITPVGDDGPGICKRIRLNTIAANTSAGKIMPTFPPDPEYPHPAPRNCANSGPATSDRENCAARMNHTAIATFPGAICGDGVQTIDEAGIYTSSNAQGGLMFARNTFGSVILGNMDTLQLEWEFSFRDALP